jgi:hypothetical protein
MKARDFFLHAFRRILVERIPAMKLRNWFRRRRPTDEIAARATEIARRCHREVALRLGQAMHRMSLPQARGYIRARAVAVLDDEIAMLAAQATCQPALLLAVRDQATEHVVRMSIGDMLQLSRQTSQLKKAA